ncbi:hypothetical protein GB937_001711 [Aspergillus fischeri]|nr:hypothetical protein GB937_001711 [Aspergillus fischeri]
MRGYTRNGPQLRWRLSKHSSILRNGLEVDFAFVSERSAVFEPRKEVFALTDIKRLQLIAALCDRFNTHTRDPDAATD